ncbi:hypothetical protein AWB67_07449 [Caballeronia terrestris]|uniref:Uncharacterized protein n=1 Tax=Caballeronia terrestris TaxID=1226301 RepID=A0A158L2M7_9BURK|nr:hypothetical protein AWB67_07449 [Caballeronia terrestris]
MKPTIVLVLASLAIFLAGCTGLGGAMAAGALQGFGNGLQQAMDD